MTHPTPKCDRCGVKLKLTDFSPEGRRNWAAGKIRPQDVLCYVCLFKEMGKK